MATMHETAQTREALWNAVHSLTDEQLNMRVAEDKWTIMQVLEHLHVVEQTINHNMQLALQQPGSHPTDVKPFHLTLDRSHFFKAPPTLEPSQTFQKLQDIRTRLDGSRHALNELVTGTTDDVLKQKSYPHPVFGQMDLRQWTDFVGIHEKRHLAQIEELKQSLSL